MPSPNKNETKDEFISRCMSDDEAQRDFPRRDQRFKFCESQWERRNNVSGKGASNLPRVVRLQGEAATDQIRRDSIAGKNYTVVPVVALKEGVFNMEGGLGPEYYPALTLAMSTPLWNGRAVTLQHPRKRDRLSMMDSPEMMGQFAIGTIFNTEFAFDDEGGPRLLMEAWLDEEKLSYLQQDDLLDKLREGVMDVSVGMLAGGYPMDAEFKGKQFVFVNQEIFPDHLAILPDQRGACSVEDGCGLPRLAQEYVEQNLKHGHRPQWMECSCQQKHNEEETKEVTLSKEDKGFLSQLFNKLFNKDGDQKMDRKTALEKILAANGEQYKDLESVTEALKDIKDEHVILMGQMAEKAASAADGQDSNDESNPEDEKAKKAANKEDTGSGKEDKGNTNDQPQPKGAAEMDFQKVLETAPPEMREFLESNVKAGQEYKKRLMEGLKNVGWTEEELAGSSLQFLEKLAMQSGAGADFSLLGAPSFGAEENKEETQAPSMPPLFAKERGLENPN